MMYSIDDVKTIIAKISNTVIQNKDTLSDLDSKSGDGDLGISMEAAFTAINTSCQEYDGDDLGAMMLKASMACNRAAPSTMGTLVSSGFLSVAKLLKSKTSIKEQEVITLPKTFTEGIVSRGKAELGDKTILDALVPMANTVEETYAETNDLYQSYKAGAVAAEEAAEATRGMQARIGRAKWLGERAAEYPDAGAMLCAIIAKSLV